MSIQTHDTKAHAAGNRGGFSAGGEPTKLTAGETRYSFKVTIKSDDGRCLTTITVALLSDRPPPDKQVCFGSLRDVFHHINIPSISVIDTGDNKDGWSGAYTFKFYGAERKDRHAKVIDWVGHVREYQASSEAVTVVITRSLEPGTYVVNIRVNENLHCAIPTLFTRSDDEINTRVDDTLRVMQNHTQATKTKFQFNVTIAECNFFMGPCVGTVVRVSLDESGTIAPEDQLAFSKLRDVFSYEGLTSPVYRWNHWWDGFYTFHVIRNVDNIESPANNTLAREEISREIDAWLKKVKLYGDAHENVKVAVLGRENAYQVIVSTVSGLSLLDNMIRARGAPLRGECPYTAAAGVVLTNMEIRRIRAGQFISRQDLVKGTLVRASSGFMYEVVLYQNCVVPNLQLQPYPRDESIDDRDLQNITLDDKRFVAVQDNVNNYTFAALVGYSFLKI